MKIFSHKIDFDSQGELYEDACPRIRTGGIGGGGVLRWESKPRNTLRHTSWSSMHMHVDTAKYNESSASRIMVLSGIRHDGIGFVAG